MTLLELRSKHPRLVYESFETKQENNNLFIRFTIVLEPDIAFHPTVTIPLDKSVDQKVIDLFAFHLGLVECISYWKAACPAELVVKARSLNQEQIDWWHDLFLNGLGEFFYKNNIDFTQKDFLKITSSSSHAKSPEVANENLDPSSEDSFPGAPNERIVKSEDGQNFVGSLVAFSTALQSDLVLVGGGKDSAVTLELLKKSNRPTHPLVLNPTRAMMDNIKIAGLNNPIIVNRTIDPKLLELNTSGYLNGHTPFSACLAFVGTFVAVLHGYENIIVSNEASASEGNVMFHGVEVNHQYSKSFRFETQFREYAQKHLTTKHQYFSLLRPLNELQISKLFSKYPQYFSSFRSCNVGSKTDTWCGNCAKCASVFLLLSPFIAKEQMVDIFGSDLFTNKVIMSHIRKLVGLEGHKPFECVSTKTEAQYAANISGLFPDMEEVDEVVVSSWNKDNFVPEAYIKLYE